MSGHEPPRCTVVVAVLLFAGCERHVTVHAPTPDAAEAVTMPRSLPPGCTKAISAKDASFGREKLEISADAVRYLVYIDGSKRLEVYGFELACKLTPVLRDLALNTSRECYHFGTCDDQAELQEGAQASLWMSTSPPRRKLFKATFGPAFDHCLQQKP